MKILKQLKLPILIYLGGAVIFIIYLFATYQQQVENFPEMPIDWNALIFFAGAWAQTVFVGYLIILAILALKKYLNEQ